MHTCAETCRSPLKKSCKLLCFCFSPPPVLATRGHFFPSAMCVGQRKRGQKDHSTSTVSLEPITQTTLLMLKRHCAEYSCSSSYLMMWKHLKLTVWWLNVMDFQHFCLLRDENPSYDDGFWDGSHISLIINPHFSTESWHSLDLMINYQIKMMCSHSAHAHTQCCYRSVIHLLCSLFHLRFAHLERHTCSLHSSSCCKDVHPPFYPCLCPSLTPHSDPCMGSIKIVFLPFSWQAEMAALCMWEVFIIHFLRLYLNSKDFILRGPTSKNPPFFPSPFS